MKSFADNQDGVTPIVGSKRGIEQAMSQRELEHVGNVKKTDRSRAIDETDRETALVELSKVSPWVAAFTPSAKATALPPPPRRPSSPFSGRPLRTKDLIPISKDILLIISFVSLMNESYNNKPNSTIFRFEKGR